MAKLVRKSSHLFQVGHKQHLTMTQDPTFSPSSRDLSAFHGTLLFTQVRLAMEK